MLISYDLSGNVSHLDAEYIYCTTSTECTVPLKWHRASKELAWEKMFTEFFFGAAIFCDITGGENRFTLVRMHSFQNIVYYKFVPFGKRGFINTAVADS